MEMEVQIASGLGGVSIEVTPLCSMGLVRLLGLWCMAALPIISILSSKAMVRRPELW